MKKTDLFFYAALLPVLWQPAGAQNQTALEALGAAAGGRGIFDGQAAGHAASPVYPAEAPASPAIPAPPPPEDSRMQTPILDKQAPIIAKARCAFQYADSGAQIEQLNKSGQISIAWSNDLIQDGNPYAFTKPAGPDGKRVVYLSTFYKNMLMDSHKSIPYSYLSSVLAHEFQHQADFEAAGMSPEDLPKQNTVNFMTELSAHTAEVYLYIRLHHNRLVPDLANETRQVQEIRLYADIYRYVNGGKRPEAKYYPQLENLDTFLTKMAYPKDKGIWSLSSIVNFKSGLPLSLRTPPTDKRELKQYNVIKKSLEKSEKDFRAWVKKVEEANAAAAAAAQHHSSTGGSSSGHAPKPPSHSGSSSGQSEPSSEHSYYGAVIYTPGGANNPTPPYAPNFGGGTGLDHPGAASF